jgi:hypothetical protein
MMKFVLGNAKNIVFQFLLNAITLLIKTFCPFGRFFPSSCREARTLSPTAKNPENPQFSHDVVVIPEKG